MKNIKAIIFDCDGTILDSERIFIETWYIVGRPMGYEIPLEVLMDNRGKDKAYGKQNILNAMGPDFPYDEVQAKRAILNEEMFLDAKKIIKPGMYEILAWTKENGMKTAVASARIQQVTSDHLKHAEFYDSFDVVIGGDMVAHNKPEPDLFLKAAELLNVDPAECLVIGDTISDMRAAKAAGMQAAFIQDLVPADEVVMSLADVMLSRIDAVIPMLSEKPEKELDVSVQSARLLDEEHPMESMKHIKSLGFDGIDLNLNSKFQYSHDEEKMTSFFDKSIAELVEYYRPIKEASKEAGVKICQAHGILVIYCKGNPELTKYRMEVTRKMMAICQFLECPALVIHPWIGGQFHADKEEEIEVNMQIYREMLPYAQKYRVQICLENLWEKHGEEYVDAPCITAEETCMYIDTFNKEAGEEIFSFCLDVGHAKFYDTDIKEYIKTVGNRMSVMHLHENAGAWDSHLAPYTQYHNDYTLSTDWEGVLEGLYEIGYKGSLSFETANAIKKLPKPVQPMMLRYIAEVGHWFKDRLEAPNWVSYRGE